MSTKHGIAQVDFSTTTVEFDLEDFGCYGDELPHTFENDRALPLAVTMNDQYICIKPRNTQGDVAQVYIDLQGGNLSVFLVYDDKTEEHHTIENIIGRTKAYLAAQDKPNGTQVLP